MKIVRLHSNTSAAAAITAAGHLLETGAHDAPAEIEVLLSGRAARDRTAEVPAGLRVSCASRTRHVPAVLRRRAEADGVVHVHSLEALSLARAVPGHQLVVSPGAEEPASRRIAALRALSPASGRDLRRAARVVCHTVGEAETVIRAANLDPSRVEVIPVAADAEAMTLAQPFSRASTTTIVAVGPLERNGRLERAVASLAVLPRDFELTVLGTGRGPTARSYRQRLTRVARDLRVDDRLRVETNADDERRRRWLRTAGTVILGSDNGTPPAVLAEAVVAGARVLVSDVRVHREAASSELGRSVHLLPWGASPLAIADAVRTGASAAAAPQSPGLPTSAEIAERMLATYDTVAQRTPALVL